MKLIYCLVVLSCVFGSLNLTAQTGKYDTRMVVDSFDCAQDRVYVNIEIKATDSASVFRMLDQRYVVRFDTLNLTAPQKEEEIVIGLVYTGGQPTFFEPHKMFLDTTKPDYLSYYIPVVGDGYLLDPIEWATIGQVSFKILDYNESIQFAIEDSLYTDVTKIIEDLSPPVEYAEYGNYNLTIVPIDSICNVTSSNIKSTSSIFKAYPNPTSDLLIVETENNSPRTDLTLYNALGQALILKTQVRPIVEIDLRHLDVGLYYLESRNYNDKRSIHKIIIAR